MRKDLRDPELKEEAVLTLQVPPMHLIEVLIRDMVETDRDIRLICDAINKIKLMNFSDKTHTYER